MEGVTIFQQIDARNADLDSSPIASAGTIYFIFESWEPAH
jgi:hypothetical protein